MSTNKKLLEFENINQNIIKRLGVQALADRPNSGGKYGDAGMSAAQLKAWFDQLSEFLANKINTIQNTFASEDIAKYIRLTLDEYDVEHLQDLIDSITDGSFADKLLMVLPTQTDTERVSLQAAIFKTNKYLADNIEEFRAKLDDLGYGITDVGVKLVEDGGELGATAEFEDYKDGKKAVFTFYNMARAAMSAVDGVFKTPRGKAPALVTKSEGISGRTDYAEEITLELNFDFKPRLIILRATEDPSVSAKAQPMFFTEDLVFDHVGVKTEGNVKVSGSSCTLSDNGNVKIVWYRTSTGGHSIGYVDKEYYYIAIGNSTYEAPTPPNIPDTPEDDGGEEITFYIDYGFSGGEIVTHTVASGTTWSEFVPDGFGIDEGMGNSIYNPLDSVFLTKRNGRTQTADMVIEDGATYYGSPTFVSEEVNLVTFNITNYDEFLEDDSFEDSVSSGTTWREWCESTYSDDDGMYYYAIDPNGYVFYALYDVPVYRKNGVFFEHLRADDVIVSGEYFNVFSSAIPVIIENSLGDVLIQHTIVAGTTWREFAESEPDVYTAQEHISKYGEGNGADEMPNNIFIDGGALANPIYDEENGEVTADSVIEWKTYHI